MAEKIQTITEIRNALRSRFAAKWAKDEAEAMATLIISEYTGISAARQLAYGSDNPEQQTVALIMGAAERALASEPLQYIFGYTTFCAHRFSVMPGVLIPRPETEEMTAMIISENRGFRGTAMDLGAGSGCIAVTIALAFNGATVYAADNSKKALRTITENADANNARISVLDIDILRSPLTGFPACDLIVSNPPYVRESEKEFMRENVIKYEPHEALFVPDSDPLLFYRRICEIASATLSPGGLVYLEINESLASETSRVFSEKKFTGITVSEDINGKKRFIKARKYD